MIKNESSIICDLPVPFNHLDHSVWHAVDQTRKLIQRHPVPVLWIASLSWSTLSY